MKAVTERRPTKTSVAIWERAIQPNRGKLSASAAQGLLAIGMSKKDLDRADVLAQKSARGELTKAEASELEDYRVIGTALEFLKSKARMALRASR